MPTLWGKENSITAEIALAHSVICFTLRFFITFFFCLFLILEKCQFITLSDMEDAKRWSTPFLFLHLDNLCVVMPLSFCVYVKLGPDLAHFDDSWFEASF